jgi:hypothetical protein
VQLQVGHLLVDLVHLLDTFLQNLQSDFPNNESCWSL